MQDSDLSDLWNEVPAQMAAIVAVLGATIGALRANGHLASAQASDVFAIADRLLPDHAGLHATSTLAAIKAIADRVVPTKPK